MGYRTPQPGGTTDIDAVVVREGKNLKGIRLFEILLVAGGKRVLSKALATTIRAIEARNSQATQAPVMNQAGSPAAAPVGCLAAAWVIPRTVRWGRQGRKAARRWTA